MLRIFWRIIIAWSTLATSNAFAELTDAGVHAPPTSGAIGYNSFMPGTAGFPALGGTYVDPVFGSTVKRLTNVTGAANNEDIYSYHYANANGTLAFHRNSSGTHIIEVATGNILYRNQPAGLAHFENHFDAVDPDKYYFLSGANLMRRNLAAQTDTLMKTFPSTLQTNGGSVNIQSRDGRYFTVRYGGSNKVWDRQTDSIYSGAVTPLSDSGWVGITPDGKYLVNVAGPISEAPQAKHYSYVIDHTNKSISSTAVQFWGLCGGHADLITASNGKSYYISPQCYEGQAGIYRVDLTLNQAGKSFEQQIASNQMLLPTAWTDDMHISAVSKGAFQDWVFISLESTQDPFNGGVASWTPYKQEIVAVNVITLEVKRLAHHRSRGIAASYGNQPRVSTSWDGSVVMWTSNFNSSSPVGYSDIYGIQNPLGTSTPPPVPPSAPIFETTFDIPEWIQTPNRGDSDAQLAPAGDGITGGGGWTTSNGSRDQVTTAANNPAGDGGRGFRHWVGNGSNNGGGAIVVNFTPSSEIWFRYYIRHQAGFAWAPGGQNMKTIYCNRNIPGTFYFGYVFGSVGGHIQGDEGFGNIAGNHIADSLNSRAPELIQQKTWNDWQGGPTGDGKFHVLEVHAKMNTTGSTGNGVFEFWLDGTKLYSNSKIRFADATGAQFTNCAVGENHTAPQNSADVYVDYDDLAISTTGYIGPLGASTPPPPDTAAPTVPTGVTATAVSTTQINLTWTASTDNTAVTGYKIYRGATQVGTSTGATYADTGLMAATNYTYQIEAYDAAGNTSAKSTAVSRMTMSADTTAPMVSNPLPTGILAAGTTSSVLSVATNEVATCKYSPTSGVAYSAMTLSLTAATSGLSHSVTLNGLSNGVVYNYYVRCRDGANNVNMTDTLVTFSVNTASNPGVAAPTNFRVKSRKLNR